MNRRLGVSTLLFFGVFVVSALATSNYEYQPGEYVTVSGGKSPDGRYLIATHGEGDLGYDNWHVYLMDAQTGRKIGPLEEITDPLDTAADAYAAKWSPDSTKVAVTYRAERHIAVTIVYRIANRRAYLKR
jgi:dipeptidyl aminopeptidase/acylaminoacyl peptidase